MAKFNTGKKYNTGHAFNLKDKDKLKLKILDDLDFGITPTYNEYGIEKEEFLDALIGLKNEKKITLELIKDHPVFEGEPKYIRITDKGREYIKSKREP